MSALTMSYDHHGNARKRRAASLTAQSLWNMQMKKEMDSENDLEEDDEVFVTKAKRRRNNKNKLDEQQQASFSEHRLLRHNINQLSTSSDINNVSLKASILSFANSFDFGVPPIQTIPPLWSLSMPEPDSGRIKIRFRKESDPGRIVETLSSLEPHYFADVSPRDIDQPFHSATYNNNNSNSNNTDIFSNGNMHLDDDNYVMECPTRQQKNITNDENNNPLPSPSPSNYEECSMGSPPVFDDLNNGWEWCGRPYKTHVYSLEKRKIVKRTCYPAMRRRSIKEGVEFDVVMVRDCVLLLADDNDQQSYVAKVASLWQHAGTGGMMMSVLWFYRPEHTEDTRVLDHATNFSDDELFASRHLDEISVACVEDKCYVLTYAQYCRFHAKRLKNSFNSDPREDILKLSNKKTQARPHQMASSETNPDLVYFAKEYYDIKMKRLTKALPQPTALFNRWRS